MRRLIGQVQMSAWGQTEKDRQHRKHSRSTSNNGMLAGRRPQPPVEPSQSPSLGEDSCRVSVPLSAAPDQNGALNSSRIAIIGLRQKLSLAGLRGTSNYIDQPVRRIAPSKQKLLLAVADALAEHGVELRDIVGPGRG